MKVRNPAIVTQGLKEQIHLTSTYQLRHSGLGSRCFVLLKNNLRKREYKAIIIIIRV